MRTCKWLSLMLLPLLIVGFVSIAGCDDDPALPPPPDSPPPAPQEEPPPLPDDFDDLGQDDLPELDL